MASFRTGLTLCGAGMAVAVSMPNLQGDLLGLSLICLGCLQLLSSRWNYTRIREALERGDFMFSDDSPPHWCHVVAQVISVVPLVVCVVYLGVWFHRHPDKLN